MNELQLAMWQLARYPKANVQDVVKALYQAEFGCGHFVDENGPGMNYLLKELSGQQNAHRECEAMFVEPLNAGFCRVHIDQLAAQGLAPETLFRLFVLSAKAPAGDMDAFCRKLDLLEEAVTNGDVPLDAAETKDFLAKYRAAGCPSTHHSDVFRAAYAPAYRVIRAKYANALPLLCAIDKAMACRDKVLVAVEGGSASGKTTLAKLLADVYDCNIFHMDDFFLQMHQRTPERFAEPGGNVDRERFMEEVLEPLQKGGAFAYRVFDCSQMALGESINVQPKKLNIIEGAYSMHPEMSHAYDLSAFLYVHPQTQADRILHRNGSKMQQRFLNEWIPLEHKYFAHSDVMNRCTMILKME